ncbi:hypothetical protein IFR05_012542 [Cadophora sp. M221]|nr:hypothetical protein IFR05_012542 [Cadophora sp. M221]
MQRLGVLPVMEVLLSLATLSFSFTYAQDINGIPTCAKECALEFIGSSNCPLTNQTCICNYLSFYDSCVDQQCNGTDVDSANEPPIPYYIPEATISISISPSCTLSTPYFPKPTASVIPSPSSISGEEQPSPTSESPKPTNPATTSSLESQGEILPTTTPVPGSTSGGLNTLTSRKSGARGQTDSTVQQTRTIGSVSVSVSASRSEVAQATFTGGADYFRVAELRISVVGLVGFVIGVL